MWIWQGHGTCNVFSLSYFYYLISGTGGEGGEDTRSRGVRWVEVRMWGGVVIYGESILVCLVIV